MLSRQAEAGGSEVAARGKIFPEVLVLVITHNGPGVKSAERVVFPFGESDDDACLVHGQRKARELALSVYLVHVLGELGKGAPRLVGGLGQFRSAAGDGDRKDDAKYQL